VHRRGLHERELQALCFLAGANSVFYGERLLTTPNAESDRDRALFVRLGLAFEAGQSGDRQDPGPCTRVDADDAPPRAASRG
jgi:biotin synthase